MDNDKEDGGSARVRIRKHEGRKRSLERTDDEDKGEGKDNSVAPARPLNSIAQLSLPNANQQQMDGMISELNSTLNNLHVGNEDKRIKIKTELPEGTEDTKMEGGTTVKSGDRDQKGNERVVKKKRMVKKWRLRELERKEAEWNMATAAGAASSSPTSNRIRGRAYKSASGLCRGGPSQKIEKGGSSADAGAVVEEKPSSSKSFGGVKEGNGFEPTPLIIPRKLPVVGDYVYAMFKNLENPWLLAEVLEILRNNHTDQTEYVVHFEPTNKRGQPTGGVEIPGMESVRKMLQVCLKMIACLYPCPFQLPVGSRVIAKLTDREDQPGQAHFYAGIIADHSKVKERPKHYLIFFDVGISQYVHADHVNLILHNDKLVWNDVHPDLYEFIKEYIIKWPSWPLVRLRLGQMVSTEWNGMWIPARIRKLDESLAYAQFENDGQCEWIFRGSARFRPAPSRLLKEEQRKMKSGTLNNFGEGLSTSSSPSAKKMKKAKACSSFSAKDIYKQVLFFSGQIDDRIVNDFRVELDDPTLCIEYQGLLRKVEIPISCPKQKAYEEHYCDWFCVVAYTRNEIFRKMSPLMIPLHFGWTRHKITEPTKHEIYYRAPCGVRLNDARILNDFLKLTQCDFPIDYFCFDYDVDCENEFVATRVLLKMADISEGKDKMAVSLVNGIDGEPPERFEYLRESEMGKGVEVIQDKGFLACCECEDGDCSDQDKCSCWQMTKQGVDFTHMNNVNYPTQGYEWRKLPDKLCTAIYECNDRCACKRSCTNRVVQNGCQWPLEVFKTRGKGWGVRTLFDIPLGTFVGYYVGEIFDSDYADEMGKEYGDEYFLQLDYIEMCASAKADFEENVTDIEMEGEGEEEESEGADDEDDSMDEGKRDERRRKEERDKERKKLKERRKLYGRKEDVYVVDSKRKGSVTRFMNHCCNPNLYPQNVFVKSQDLRFPMVALFTSMLIKAGSELTWDYNYSVGAVAGTEVHCQCMAYNCKGRLL